MLVVSKIHFTVFYVKQTRKGIENLQYIDENQVNNNSNINLLFVTGTRLNPTRSGQVRFQPQ